jgi:hypothetical protein
MEENPYEAPGIPSDKPPPPPQVRIPIWVNRIALLASPFLVALLGWRVWEMLVAIMGH